MDFISLIELIGPSGMWLTAYVEIKETSRIGGLIHENGEGNGNPLQYPCLENPTDRWAQCATVHRVTKSQIQLSNWTTTVDENKKEYSVQNEQFFGFFNTWNSTIVFNLYNFSDQKR